MSGAAECAALFRRMAERIEATDETEFGGVVVVLPPLDQNGKLEPIEVLILDPMRDLATFWAMARSKVEIAASVFEQKSLARNSQQGFR